MLRIFRIILLLFCFSSCKNEEAKVEPMDSVSVTNKIAREDSSAIFSNDVNAWVHQSLGQNAAAVNDFALEEHWKDEQLTTTSVKTDDNFYKDYASVLRWSPDSSYVIDIGSYGSVLVKDKSGKTTVEPGEPDTELALLQPKKNLRTQLMFVGPSSQIIDAKWIDKQQALVIGTFDKTGNGTNDTLAWMIDVKNNFFRLYNVKSHR